MGRHVAGDMPALDRLVDDACAEIGREIDALCVPRLAGVVLGGGYGRGEGGIANCGNVEMSNNGNAEMGIAEGNAALDNGCFHNSTIPQLSNDLDFFAITEPGVSEAEAVPKIAAAIEPVSKKWTAELGVDVDFAVKTPWRLKHDEERLMVQELLRGHFDVAGRKGEELFAGIRLVDAAELPWSEAARLLMNRGMGLLLAKEEGRRKKEEGIGKGTSDFINRNINKCVLGAGDARLIALGTYRWKAEDRAAALGDALYSAAVEWKFRPKPEPVCDWETAREMWLAAEDEVSRFPRQSRSSSPSRPSSPSRRTLRSAVRWLVRRRTLGELSTFGLMPELRVLRRVSSAIRHRRGISPSLLRDWEVFN